MMSVQVPSARSASLPENVRNPTYSNMKQPNVNTPIHANTLPGQATNLGDNRTIDQLSNNPQVDPNWHMVSKKVSLYKTELCRSFEETGYCRYGLKCQFAHDVSELRAVVRHPRYKTEICKTYWELGTCPYGKRCCFIHTENKQQNKSKTYCLLLRHGTDPTLDQNAKCIVVPPRSDHPSMQRRNTISSLGITTNDRIGNYPAQYLKPSEISKSPHMRPKPAGLPSPPGISRRNSSFTNWTIPEDESAKFGTSPDFQQNVPSIQKAYDCIRVPKDRAVSAYYHINRQLPLRRASVQQSEFSIQSPDSQAYPFNYSPNENFLQQQHEPESSDLLRAPGSFHRKFSLPLNETMNPKSKLDEALGMTRGIFDSSGQSYMKSRKLGSFQGLEDRKFSMGKVPSTIVPPVKNRNQSNIDRNLSPKLNGVPGRQAMSRRASMPTADLGVHIGSGNFDQRVVGQSHIKSSRSPALSSQLASMNIPSSQQTQKEHEAIPTTADNLNTFVFPPSAHASEQASEYAFPGPAIIHDGKGKPEPQSWQAQSKSKVDLTLAERIRHDILVGSQEKLNSNVGLLREVTNKSDQQEGHLPIGMLDIIESCP